MKLFLASLLSLLVIYTIRRLTDRAPDEFVDMPPEQVLRDVDAMCQNGRTEQAISYLRVYCERFPDNISLQKRLIALQEAPAAQTRSSHGASNLRRAR